jgi:hypothetical protein
MLLFFLLLSVIKGIFGITCTYSEEPLTWSLDEFNYDEFKIQIDALPSSDFNDDNDYKCRVEMYIDYKSRLFTISFGDSFTWSLLEHGEARLDFLILFNQNTTEAELYNILEYACSDQDQCDKLFAHNHIHWLKHINYTLFEIHVRSLLLNNINQTGEFEK